MRRVLVHLGSPKTGTTSIQVALADAAASGGLGAVAYPHATEPNQGLLAVRFQPLDRQPGIQRSLAQQRPRSHRAEVERFERAWAAALDGDGDLLVSAEYLWRFDDEEAAALVAHLRAAGFEQVVALAYVRRPADYYLSLVQQRLRFGARIGPPRSAQLSILPVLDRWSALTDELLVRPFIRAELIDGDAVADAFAAMGTALGTTFVRRDQQVPEANVSISAEAMVLLQRYRATFHADRVGQGTPDTYRLLTAMNERTPAGHPRPVLDRSLAAAIQQRSAAELDDIRRRFGVDLHDPSLDDVERRWPTTGNLTHILGNVDHDHLTDLAVALLGDDIAPPKPGRRWPPDHLRHAAIDRLGAVVSRFTRSR